ncbi:MAG: ABC transporter permease [Deltaproteobacteria bacterium]|nr:MAG: ABC transporter permease [Deltaproteobacteria bacterium]
MNAVDLGSFAVTALVRHRLRTGLSLLGVAIGVAAVVALTALGEGARRYVTGQFASLGSNLLIVIPGKNETTGSLPGVGGVPNDLTLEDARALQRSLPQAQLLAPIATGNETVSYRERSRQVPVLGATYELLEIRELSVAAGRFLPPGEMERGGPVIVLGAKLADELFPGESPVGRPIRIGDWRMRVIGVLAHRGTQLGLDIDDVAIVPAVTAMRMFNRTSLFRIVMKIHAHSELDATCDRVVEILTERHQEEDVTCITQDSVVSALSSILTALTLALGGIAAISLSVAGIGIMNLMLVSVSERTREVGLLKAVGAANGQILAVFLTEAILLATAGGLLGLLLGQAAIAILVAIYPAFPAATPLWALSAALGLSVGVGALFGVLPARRAARLDPVAALSGR